MTQIYTAYPEAWQIMLDDCRSATDYIYFEQFIWQDLGSPSSIGTQFLDVFKQKTREGVRVRVLVDAIGSVALSSNYWWQKGITEAGVELEIFGLVPKWKSQFPFSLFHRNHRKLLVIDDRIAHVSGVIVSERARDWLDIGVRLTDPAYIRDVKGAFLRMWDEVRGTQEHAAEYDGDNGRLLKNDPENNDLYQEIRQRVKTAKCKISIVTPYFSPDWRMMRALKKARKRGVQVEIILPEKCDSKITSTVAQSYLRSLVRYKIDTYHYRDCMNHGKLVQVDDWVTLGSMNFDRLSFFCNRELNVVFTESLQDFERTISEFRAKSRKVTRKYFRKRGLRFLLEEFLGKIMRPIA